MAAFLETGDVGAGLSPLLRGALEQTDSTYAFIASAEDGKLRVLAGGMASFERTVRPLTFTSGSNWR